MALRFSREHESPSANDAANKGPPKYSSRAVQVRLLLLVFALMTVIVAMNKARDPNAAFYRLFGFQQGDSAADATAVNENIDTTLRKPQKAVNEQNVDVVTIKKLQQADGATDEAPASATGLIWEEKNQRWQAMLETISAADRRLLFKLLKLARDQAPTQEQRQLDAEEQIAWLEVLRSLDQQWREQLTQSRQAVDEMADDDPDKDAWALILARLDEYWMLIKDSLVIASEGQLLVSQDFEVLDELQAICDDYAFQLVEDNTVATRWQEFEAWFRTLERLQSPDAFLDEDPERVGFLQLFKQPKHYRGKPIKVRGVARMAYHVQSRKNLYGIEGYYVFVVRPSGGPNDPMIVYSLELPHGFPAIKDRDKDRETTELNEEVEFTGYFFKNCAYRAKDGTRIAPLIMAKAPTWDGADAVALNAKPKEPPSIKVLGGAIGAIALVAILLAAWVYRQSNAQPADVAAYNAANRAQPDELNALSKDEGILNLNDRLAQLSTEHAEGDPSAATSTDRPPE